MWRLLGIWSVFPCSIRSFSSANDRIRDLGSCVVESEVDVKDSVPDVDEVEFTVGCASNTSWTVRADPWILSTGLICACSGFK
jgi:hypothetical protein